MSSCRTPSDASRRRVRGHRRHRVLARPQRDAQAGGPDRLRLRPDLRLPAPARHLPLARGRGQGDRAQPALGRRRLRADDPRLPAGLGRGPPQLRVERRHRLVVAAVHVRDPVRALDGLPRVHPEPHPRGLRPRALDRGRRRARDQDHRRRRHQRRPGDGRGVRDLRHAADPRHEGDGHRPRRRRPHRRHHRAGGALAGRDDPPRRPQLVPAPLGSSGCRDSSIRSRGRATVAAGPSAQVLPEGQTP